MSLRWKDTIKLLGGRFLSKCLFLILRLVFLFFQKLSWKVSGVSDVVDRNQELEKRGKKPVAQALKLLWFNKYCFLLPPSLRDFILQHDEYVDPEYVIRNDHVSLFFFDPNQDVAVFGEGKPGQKMWHTSAGDSFISISLYRFSQRLIIMRMKEFHELCASLPDPKKSIIVMGNTARCGSTLLTQGFCSEVSQMTRNLVRMYCRPLNCMLDVEGYLLKPSGPSSACAAPIHAQYPQITKNFYLYRNMHDVTLSLYKLSFILPTSRFVYLLTRLSGALVSSIYQKAHFPTDGTNRKISNCHTTGIMQATVSTKMYMVMKNGGLEVMGLLFDDILANKELAVRAIFKASGLPESLVADALQAFDRDSQSNSIVAMPILAKIKPLEFTKQHEIESSKLLVEMGFPPLEEECRLEGTIDFKKVLNLK
uniref:Sulfotransferase domain-containing protein n=1 Tax=Capitella teleta TaxID=283909 RepID=X1ZY05_CAPTE